MPLVPLVFPAIECTLTLAESAGAFGQAARISLSNVPLLPARSTIQSCVFELQDTSLAVRKSDDETLSIGAQSHCRYASQSFRLFFRLGYSDETDGTPLWKGTECDGTIGQSC